MPWLLTKLGATPCRPRGYLSNPGSTPVLSNISYWSFCPHTTSQTCNSNWCEEISRTQMQSLPFLSKHSFNLLFNTAYMLARRDPSHRHMSNYLTALALFWSYTIAYHVSQLLLWPASFSSSGLSISCSLWLWTLYPHCTFGKISCPRSSALCTTSSVNQWSEI